jgi:hypothetical protein
MSKGGELEVLIMAPSSSLEAASSALWPLGLGRGLCFNSSRSISLGTPYREALMVKVVVPSAAQIGEIQRSSGM